LGPVLLISRLFPGHPELPFVTALAAVAGHIFPVWLKFRGGKGVATGLGAFVLLAPKAILVALIIFVLVLAVFRFVALGSIIASGSLLLAACFFREGNRPGIAMIAASSLLIIVKHHTNIVRMLKRTEPKFLD
jgi:glycerol-3-phosphate acyltransferase PlsY